MTYDSAECSSRETNFSTSISNVESLGSQLRRLSQVVTMFLMSWIGIFLRAAAHIAKSTNDLPAFWLTSLLHKALIQSLLLLRFLHFSAAAKIASMGNVFNCKSEKKSLHCIQNNIAMHLYYSKSHTFITTYKILQISCVFFSPVD